MVTCTNFLLFRFKMIQYCISFPSGFVMLQCSGSTHLHLHNAKLYFHCFRNSINTLYRVENVIYFLRIFHKVNSYMQCSLEVSNCLLTRRSDLVLMRGELWPIQPSSYGLDKLCYQRFHHRGKFGYVSFLLFIFGYYYLCPYLT